MMASEKRTALAQMQAKIAQVKKSARELNSLGQGIPVIEKNIRSILATTTLLEYGISDVAEIENQSRRKAMGEVTKIKTVCRSCHGGCGVIAHVQDGKVVKVEGDPDSPISHGTLCSKGLAITQLAYHPDRILLSHEKNGWRMAAHQLGRRPGHHRRAIQGRGSGPRAGGHRRRTGHRPGLREPPVPFRQPAGDPQRADRRATCATFRGSPRPW